MKYLKEWIIFLVIVVVGTLISFKHSSIFDSMLSYRINSAKSKQVGSSVDIPENYQKILLINGSNNALNQQISTNVLNCFKSGKIQYTVSNSGLDNLSEYSMVLINSESKDEIIAASKLQNYLEQGGRVVVLCRSLNPTLNALAGITSMKGFINNETGIEFERSYFPIMDSLAIDSKMLNASMLDVSLSQSATLYAISEKSKIPMIFSHKVGKGEILYFNTTLLSDKLNRGVLMAGIGNISSQFAYVIYNYKMMDIDDFPSPISATGKNEIFDEYGVSTVNFYKYYWWPDMEYLAQKYGLLYTTFSIGDYNFDSKLPLAKLHKSDLELNRYFGRKVLEKGGELGIHGYNHLPLALAGEMEFSSYGYIPWASKEAMEEGLKIVLEEYKVNFKKLKIYSYVPPSNILPLQGKSVVVQEIKELKAIGGIYTGAKEKGVLIQEIGVDPDFPSVIDVPRFSSGYLKTPETMWSISNALSSYGVFHHFIHPDDVISSDRSKGKKWKELRAGLTDIVNTTITAFPTLKPITMGNFANEYKEHESGKIYEVNGKNSTQIIFKDAYFPMSIFFWSNDGQKIKSVNGGTSTLIRSIDGKNLYVIECQEEKVTINY